MRVKTSLCSVFFALGAMLGCGDDSTPPAPDGGSVDAGGVDGGVVDGGSADGGGDLLDCLGMPDGTVCGDGFSCRGGLCRAVRCGDGVVDEAAGEQCDDGNEVPGDGCEPGSCTFSCETAEVCDDGAPCNGAEECNTAMHRCQAGPPAMMGTACTLEAGGPGVCTSTGLCAAAGCGNSIVDGMEQCDDGANGDNADGCKDDCTFTCETDADCVDADACNGAESCVASSHTCLAAAALDCDDMDTCTIDSCDMMAGCVHALDDADGDGYAPAASCTTMGLRGGDCGPMNDTIYPGAPELCDMLDNDCDGMTDEMPMSVVCLRDTDGDGYGGTGGSMMACMCPSGYIPPRSDGAVDCADNVPSAHPGQRGWFTGAYHRGGLPGWFSYDYDCDGTDTKRYTALAATGCSRSSGMFIWTCIGAGWAGTTVPRCGDTASYYNCTLLGSTCNRTLGSRQQSCR